CLFREFRVAFDDGRIEPGSLPAFHGKREIYLLRLRIALSLRMDGTFVKTVAFEQLFQIAFRLGHLSILKWLSQMEPAGIRKLPAIGRIVNLPFGGDAPHEPAIPGHEPDDDALRRRFGLYLDIGIAAGGIEAVDGIPNCG